MGNMGLAVTPLQILSGIIIFSLLGWLLFCGLAMFRVARSQRHGAADMVEAKGKQRQPQEAPSSIGNIALGIVAEQEA